MCSHCSSGWQHCLSGLLYKVYPLRVSPSSPLHPGTGTWGREVGWGRSLCIPPVEPIIWGLNSCSSGTRRLCLLATIPCPLSLLGRRRLPENEPLFPSPAASSCPCRAVRQTKAEPDAMGRRLDLLLSSRSRSNPTGEQTDACLGGMGRDTPIFSCFCIPTPFLPWAKNTWAAWTGKIIRIKELSRPCVQPLPWLSPLPFDQNGFPKHCLPLPTWMTYLFIPIPYIPTSSLCTLYPSSPLHATPPLLCGCISHSLMVPFPMPHQP